MRARNSLLLLLGSAALTACALEEVELAPPENIVIAEIILRAGATTQLAWLHRTRAPFNDPLVANATVQISGPNRMVTLRPMPDTACIIPRGDTPPGTIGTCYSTTAADSFPVTPGQTYHLTINVDGKVLTGTTMVPNDFTMIRPTVTTCSLPPMTNFSVQWHESAGAWVYAAETNLRNIRTALAPHGVTVDRDPLRLFGLSISSADTALAFPKEFGLFDRFDEDLTEALAFMQQGLPPGVIADVSIAATDRNYVNWERGGNFNPSGQVRVPSIRGGGSGVFGSMVPKNFQVRTDVTNRPPC